MERGAISSAEPICVPVAQILPPVHAAAAPQLLPPRGASPGVPVHCPATAAVDEASCEYLRGFRLRMSFYLVTSSSLRSAPCVRWWLEEPAEEEEKLDGREEAVRPLPFEEEEVEEEDVLTELLGCLGN